MQSGIVSSKDTSEKIPEGELNEFRIGLRGQLLQSNDAGYEEARKVWNGMIDKRPAMIVRCAGVSDVLTCVRFAKKHGLVVAVRGGGHNVAGNATCDGGMLIDFSKMKSVRVDPRNRTAQAEPGLTWSELDRETQQFGLAVTGGLVSNTGIAGFTLGGGVGWLARKYGLTLDNLISADVVTAEGKLLKASATENPDLFWGIRGGGGNFGIITSFEYELHPVGPTVLGGMVILPISKGKELLRFYGDFARTAPDELTTVVAMITAPPAPFLPREIQNTKVIAVAGCYIGPFDQGQKVIEPLTSFDPSGINLFQQLPYRVLQSLLDASAPPGIQNYWKSEYIEELSDEAIETILEFFSKAKSPLSAVHLHQMGGAISRVPEESTAYSHRDASFILNIIASWIDPRENAEHINWSREFFGRMERYSRGGVYVNFLGEEGQHRVRAAYGDAKYKLLVDLKRKYDPTNFFRLNQNIAP